MLQLIFYFFKKVRQLQARVNKYAKNISLRFMRFPTHIHMDVVFAWAVFLCTLIYARSILWGRRALNCGRILASHNYWIISIYIYIYVYIGYKDIYLHSVRDRRGWSQPAALVRESFINTCYAPFSPSLSLLLCVCFIVLHIFPQPFCGFPRPNCDWDKAHSICFKLTRLTRLDLEIWCNTQIHIPNIPYVL